MAPAPLVARKTRREVGFKEDIESQEHIIDHPGIAEGANGVKRQSCCERTIVRLDRFDEKVRKRQSESTGAVFQWRCFQGARESCLGCASKVNFNGFYLGTFTVLFAAGICGITALLLCAGINPKGGLLQLDEISVRHKIRAITLD